MTELEQAARHVFDAWNHGSPLDTEMAALEEALAEQATEPAGRCKWCLAYNGHLDFCHELAEQAEQEPVAELFLGGIVDGEYGECEVDPWQRNIESLQKRLVNDDKPVRLNLYAAPVRAKDLTDAEIADIGTNCGTSMWSLMFARAVIAADREKNK